MGLAARVIPTLLCRGRTLVKGKRFDAWRAVGVTAQAVRIYQAREVDELVLLDIAATKEKRGPDVALVEELTAGCFMPLAIGGGIRSVADVRALLKAGADKVVIRTAGRSVISDVANAFGTQAVVAAMDVTTLDPIGAPTPQAASPKLIEIAANRAQSLVEAGAGEILLTRCEYEGEMAGYDLPLIRAVAEAVTVPVVAHGGAGTYQHMLEALQAGASAVAAGSMFQFTDQTPRGATEYLAKHGIEVRL